MDGLTIIELEANRDARGWNTRPLDEKLLSGGGLANIHVVSIEPGAIRGNHRHFAQTERALIIGGPCLFVAQDTATGERFERIFQPGELFRIEAAPGVAHGFKNVGRDVVYLLCASDLPFDSDNPDTERIILID